MGILQKLMGAIKAGDGMGPEGVSEQVQKLMPQQRAPRVQISWLHHLCFRPEGSFGSQPVRVANLSTSGIGLICLSPSDQPAAGSVIRGALDFSGDRIPVIMEVVHGKNSIVGCKFEGDEGRLVDTIKRYLEVELLALSVIYYSPAEIGQVPQGTPYWFHGGDRCGLFFLVDGMTITRFHLYFYANYFLGGEDGPTRYGKIAPPSAPGVGHRFVEPSMVDWEVQVPQNMIDVAIKFLTNIKQLTPEHRTIIIEKLRKSNVVTAP